MTQHQTQTNASDEGEEEGPPPEYLIEVAQADQESRVIALVIASRRCYEDQRADDTPPTRSSDPQDRTSRRETSSSPKAPCSVRRRSGFWHPWDLTW